MGFHVKKSGSVGNIGGNSREKSGIQKVLNSPQDPSRNDRPGIYPPGAPRKRSHSWCCSGPLDFACAYHPEGSTVIMKGHTPVWGPKRAMYPALQHLPHRSKQPQNGFAYCQYHEQGLCQIALESRNNSALNRGLNRLFNEVATSLNEVATNKPSRYQVYLCEFNRYFSFVFFI